jgi:molybdopterin-binding protein
MEVPLKPRRPPSLPLVCALHLDHSSFSVLRETPVALSCAYFKKLNCCGGCNAGPQRVSLPAECHRFAGTVKEIRENDGAVQVTVEVGEETLRAEISQDHLSAMSLAPGDRVHGILKLRSLRGVG